MRVCDKCKAKLETEPVKISFGYGSIMDGGDYEFCSDDCGIHFLTEHWVKRVIKRKEDILKG